MKNSTLIKYTRCPRCAERGKDRKGYNLGVYSDGHSFCYSCKLYIEGDKLYSLKHPVIKKIEHKVMLPSDVNVSYPKQALDWMGKYELTRNDLISNNILWSESYKRLIFPIYDGKKLLAWQGRYFGEESKPKWYSKGNLKEVYHILGKGQTLILVEDVVSAIKLSRYTAAMPIFGSVIGLERWNRLKHLNYKTYFIWLDPDKRKESLIEVRLANSLGLDTNVLFTEIDPKEISYEELNKLHV